MNVYPPVASGGGSLYPPNLTDAHAELGADVAMTTANTPVDGPSVSLAAGTWAVWGFLDVLVPTSGSSASGRITDGTTVYDEREGNTGTTAREIGIPLFARIVLGSTTTIKLTAISPIAASTLKANPTVNSSAVNTATRMYALRVA